MTIIPVITTIVVTTIIAICSFVSPADGISLSIVVSAFGSSGFSMSSPPSPGISGSYTNIIVSVFSLSLMLS